MCAYFSCDFFSDLDRNLPAKNKNIPFFRYINKLFFQPSEKDEFPIHGPNVIRFAAALLDPNLQGGKRLKETGLKSRHDGTSPNEVNHVLFLSPDEYGKNFYERILGALEANQDLEKSCEFLKVCALFHDIGKVIRRANHPQIGANMLRNFDLKQTRKLVDAFSIKGEKEEESRINRFARLTSVVQHHDKFGVVSTGEGGLSIFNDILYFRSDARNLAGINKNITSVMLLNLADTAAVNNASDSDKVLSSQLVKSIYQARENDDIDAEKEAAARLGRLYCDPKNCRGLDANTVRSILSDWEILTKAVNDNSGDPGLLKRRLLEIERNPSRTIERIVRILSTAAFNCGAGVISKYLTPVLVESVLVGALGSYQLQSFCDRLASVVKFDYGLGFFRALVCGCVRRVLKTNNAIHSKESKELEREETIELNKRSGQWEHIAEMATDRLIQVLKGLLGRYASILSRSGGEPRRFGVQMSSLSNENEILAAIINFLCYEHKEYMAVTWISDEVSIWSLD